MALLKGEADSTPDAGDASAPASTFEAIVYVNLHESSGLTRSISLYTGL